MPRVWNRNTQRPPESAIYIGRPSAFGNPFRIGPDGDRSDVIRKYASWIRSRPNLMEKARRELRGKDLVCYCAPYDCHGDVLLEIANSMSESPAVKRTIEVVEAELAAARAALEAAKKSRDVEMTSSKEEFADERDPTGWEGFAENVYQAFFDGYPLVAEMIDSLKSQVSSRGWVISPTGRRRTLFRILTGNRKFIADAQRRGVNSPIQGVSSEGGITAGHLIIKEFHRFLRVWQLQESMFTLYCRAVHDANYFEEAVPMLLPAVHIHQHVATVGLGKHFEEVYGKKFPLDMEIDLEIGPSDARGESWNWVMDELPKIIINAIDGRVADGYIKASRRDTVVKQAMDPWVRKDMRHWLQSEYPLMQVTDLEQQICTALRRSGFEPEV